MQTAASAPPPAIAAVAAPRLSAGSVIGRTYAVWWRNLPTFAAAVLLLELPSLAIIAASGSVEPGHSAFRVQMFLSSLTWVAVSLALARGTLDVLSGETVRIGRMLRAAGVRLFPAFLVSLGTGLVTGFGLLLLVVPGIMAACAFWVAIPAVVAEPELVPSSAMRRSGTLTDGSRIAVLGALAATFGLPFASMMAASIVLSTLLGDASPALSALLEEALGTVLLAPAAIAPAIGYHHLRLAREGHPAAALGSVFE